MIPKSVYKILPYCYIVGGLLCLFIIESPLIIFSSLIFMVAGVMVLWMRHKQSNPLAVKVKKTRPVKKDVERSLDDDFDLLDHERRVGDDRDFPLSDDNGMMIPFDRRNKKDP